MAEQEINQRDQQAPAVVANEIRGQILGGEMLEKRQWRQVQDHVSEGDEGGRKIHEHETGELDSEIQQNDSDEGSGDADGVAGEVFESEQQNTVEDFGQNGADWSDSGLSGKRKMIYIMATIESALESKMIEILLRKAE